MASKIGSTDKSTCCSCFGRRKDVKPSNPYPLQRSQRFHSYRPTDINQVVSQSIDDKAKKEAHTAAGVFMQIHGEKDDTK